MYHKCTGISPIYQTAVRHPATQQARVGVLQPNSLIFAILC